MTETNQPDNGLGAWTINGVILLILVVLALVFYVGPQIFQQ